MINEITAATTFIALHLPKTVPETSRARFRETLARNLQQRFIPHWDPEVPLRGNAYRSLSLHCGRLDNVILGSMEESDVDASLLRMALPDDFVMWIDPFCVSYRVGEHGSPVVIWEDRAALASTGCPVDFTAAIADLVNRTPQALPHLVDAPELEAEGKLRRQTSTNFPDTSTAAPASADSHQGGAGGDSAKKITDVKSKCASSSPISSAPIAVA